MKHSSLCPVSEGYTDCCCQNKLKEKILININMEQGDATDMQETLSDLFRYCRDNGLSMEIENRDDLPEGVYIPNL